MNQITTSMYNREPEYAKLRENQARGNLTAYEVAAEKAATTFGIESDNRRRKHHGNALHWATGIGAAIAYSVLRRQARGIAAAKGLVFGAGFFLLADELLNTALGLTPDPRAFPWQTHARGLGAHLAYGLTTELMLEQLDGVA